MVLSFVDLTTALGQCGFNYMQQLFLSSLEQHNPQLKNAQYQCAWKLGQWDIEEPREEEKTFNYYQYAALKDINQRNYESARMNVDRAKNSLVHKIARVGLESTKNVYHVLARLQCLQVRARNEFILTEIEQLVTQWLSKFWRLRTPPV